MCIMCSCVSNRMLSYVEGGKSCESSWQSDRHTKKPSGMEFLETILTEVLQIVCQVSS